MKILSASTIRKWDSYTVKNEPIASLELMNRAAQVFCAWFIKNYPPSSQVLVLVGTGNNGGDGLAVARLLQAANYRAKVLVCDFGGRHSTDFDQQFNMIAQDAALALTIVNSFPAFREACEAAVTPNQIIIDALFGSGLTRPLSGEWLPLVAYLNESAADVVSIDLPSGLYCDASSVGNSVVKAARTFSFEMPKLAFFFPENAAFVGAWRFESIGLHQEFEKEAETDFYFLTASEAKTLRRARSRFSHKGSFGHALLIAGSYGKMGAAVLAARGCLRSGVGLLTAQVPQCGNLVLQSLVPEAMVITDLAQHSWSELRDLQEYTCIGVGPGIGRADVTRSALNQLINHAKQPLILDADALNIIADKPELLKLLPANSILTPHPKEFERLFGKATSDFERNALQRRMAQELGVFIVLKGAFTAIACPDGDCWFNSTGNPGMATGGSGDVLTGIITGLVAQGYDAKSACLLGVYLHGLAGDLAAAAMGQEALLAGDLPKYLGKAWETLD